MLWVGVNRISILLIVLKFKVERRIFFLRRRKLKFNPYSKPVEPVKPSEPDKMVLTQDYSKSIKVCDSEVVELSGKYRVDFIDEYCAEIVPLELVENIHYENQLKHYHSSLKKYETSFKQYKKELKQYNADLKVYQETQKEKELDRKRKLLEQLKKELGET